jgi:hypothetical protein
MQVFSWLWSLLQFEHVSPKVHVLGAYPQVQQVKSRTLKGDQIMGVVISCTD